MADDIQNIKDYGGEESDDYNRLVLGRHGEAAFSVIPRDSIKLDPVDVYEFHNFRYSQTDKQRRITYQEALGCPKKPEKLMKRSILAIDTGFTDPTVIHLIGQDDTGIWRILSRYRLTRIPFPEQADIIDWIDSKYEVDHIAIDLGAGGGGIPLAQDLMSNRFSRSRYYSNKIFGVRFSDMVHAGFDNAGNEMKIMAKSYGGQELARIIQDHQLVFSEIDAEGLSQMERVAYQKQADGSNKYFVLSDKGAGKSQDDHIFASLLVFMIALTSLKYSQPRKKLTGARWIDER